MTLQLSRRRFIASATLSAFLTGCGVQRRPAAYAAAPAAPNWAQATSAELQAAKLDERTRAFYEARTWRPAWTAQTAGQLQAAVGDLKRHGLDPSRLAVDLNAGTAAEREINLTQTALRYGDILAHGVIDPDQVFDIFALDRNQVDLDGSLSTALDRKLLAQWIDSLPPQDDEYRALTDAYVRSLAEAAKPQPATIPAGKPIKPGMKDPRIPQIKDALVAGGYLLVSDAPDDPNAAPSADYNASLVDAVKLFQDRQGINADGVIGADTVAVMNAGPEDRARQIALNLESRRWLARNPPATRIDVNTAATVLEYYRDGQLIDRRRTITGKHDTPTPNLATNFDHLVINPPWNVPAGIAAKEILPKGAAYLAREDMYVDGGRVIQRPGPKSALGRVKFDMQDRYAIYLHDTPSKAPFQNNERHLSHGCVRVDDAVGFAHILTGEVGKSADLDGRLATQATSTLQLGKSIPVRIFYHTAFLDPSGAIAFRPDVYGWDEALATALGMPPPMQRAVAPTAGIDIGP